MIFGPIVGSEYHSYYISPPGNSAREIEGRALRTARKRPTRCFARPPHLRSVGHDAHLVERGLPVEEDNVAVFHVSLHDVSDLEVLRQLLPDVLDEELLHEPVPSIQPYLCRESLVAPVARQKVMRISGNAQLKEKSDTTLLTCVYNFVYLVLVYPPYLDPAHG